MAKLYVPLDIDNAHLTDASQKIFDLVRQGFEEKRKGIAVNDATRHIAIFQDLEEGELTKIAGICRIVEFGAGEAILRAGEQGDYFFMLLDGELDILAQDESTLVGHVHRGDFLGEISLVSAQPYTATAVAATDVKMVALNHKDFEALINRHPRIGMKVMRNIAISVGEKLRHLDNLYSENMKSNTLRH